MATAETALLIEKLLTTDVSAATLIIEAADKYLPIIDGLTITLENGEQAKATAIEPEIAQKVEETRQALRREDRIMWALRLYKKSLAYELLWLCRNDPGFIQKKFGQPPAPQQPQLERQLQKLADVDITPFQEHDPNDPEDIAPAYTGYSTIDTIIEWIGGYIQAGTEFAQGRFQEVGKDQAAQLDKAFTEKNGRPPGPVEHGDFEMGGTKFARREGKWWSRQYRQNPILDLIFQRQSFGEIISIFRRTNLFLERRFRGTLEITSNPWRRGKEDPHDMRDEEGEAETIVRFPNGWRWLNLHRPCSHIRDDLIRKRISDPRLMVTGHCCNVAAPKEGDEVLELVEPMGGDRWRHHACFIFNRKHGILGEMKGRMNQKPSPALYKYIFELLRRYKPIQGLVGTYQGQYGAMHDVAAHGDFNLKDLPREMINVLRDERPELWVHSAKSQLPPDEEKEEKMKRLKAKRDALRAAQQQGQGGVEQGEPIPGHLQPPQQA